MITRSRIIALLFYMFLVPFFGLNGQNQALDAEKLNQEFIQILNQHRSSKGLRALTLDPSYYPFVLEHSKTMARDDDAHHDRFEQRAKAYWRESGKKVRLAENAAFFYLPTEGDEEELVQMAASVVAGGAVAASKSLLRGSGALLGKACFRRGA